MPKKEENDLEKTLVHEDIYAYVDPIDEYISVKTGSTMDFVNDSRNGVVDQGEFIVTCKSGEVTKLVINDGNKNVEFVIGLKIGEKAKLDFRNNHFSKAGELFFSNDIIDLQDDKENIITVTLEGGEAEVEYTYEKATEVFTDITFLESINVDETKETIKKTLANGKEKFIKSTKKTYSFSINGIWNRDEIGKFIDAFRLRLVDENGNPLETLAYCVVDSKGRSSSSGGDLTYTVSGSCQKIY